MANYAYVRVSSADQKESRQINALEQLNIPMTIFMDKQSGKDFQRPQYQELVNRLRKGDVLYVCSIDRLGRNYRETMDQWRILTREIGVGIRVLDFPVLNVSAENDSSLTELFISDLVLQILSYVAETERNFIHIRQAEGIAAARLRGDQLGRPAKKIPETFAQDLEDYRAGRVSRSELEQKYGICTSTFYKWSRLYWGEASLIAGKKEN